MTTHPADSHDLVPLDRVDVEYLLHLITRVEDWLRHAGDEAREDLAEFLNTPGNGRLAAAGLVASLSENAAVLHRRLRDNVRPTHGSRPPEHLTEAQRR